MFLKGVKEIKDLKNINTVELCVMVICKHQVKKHMEVINNLFNCNGFSFKLQIKAHYISDFFLSAL